MIRIRDIKNKFEENLKILYTSREINQIFYLVIEEITNISKSQLLTIENLDLNNEDCLFIDNFLTRLNKNEHIQYILGSPSFYGLNLTVNNHTLRPRPAP